MRFVDKADDNKRNALDVKYSLYLYTVGSPKQSHFCPFVFGFVLGLLLRTYVVVEGLVVAKRIPCSSSLHSD